MTRFVAFLMCVLLAVGCPAARRVTWVIDAGHGGRDVGCEGRGTREKDITLAVAKELGQLVRRNIKGVRVVYTRETDTYLTLQQRCDVANAAGAALFLSVHVNSAENPFARGTESFFAANVPLTGANAGKSELLALLLQKHYLAHGREISRGVKKRELYVVEHTLMPSVLTEVGFISNLGEEAYLTSRQGVAELAAAICEALKEWKELTKDGTVPQRSLRDLRYSHYAPVSMAAGPEAPAPDSPTPPAAPPAPAGPAPEADAPEPDSPQPYFAIQLMNTAAPLPPGDPRLHGYTGVSFLPAAQRFKAVHGHFATYEEAKDALADVRRHFPEAFVVAFDGQRQVSTAEAIRMLKP